MDAYHQMGVYTGRILKAREVRGPGSRILNKVRVGDQRRDREAARYHRAASAVRPRRRGDRIGELMTASGT